MSKLNGLKQTYPEFTPESFSYSLNGAIKWYRYTTGANHVLAVGNFDITLKTANLTFPATGKWYEFFSRDSVDLNVATVNIDFQPGEYRLYSTRKFDESGVSTKNTETSLQNIKIVVYPNPARNEINISAAGYITELQIYSVTGKQILNQKCNSVNQIKLNTEDFSPGIYLLRVVQNNQVLVLKFVKE